MATRSSTLGALAPPSTLARAGPRAAAIAIRLARVLARARTAGQVAPPAVAAVARQDARPAPSPLASLEGNVGAAAPGRRKAHAVGPHARVLREVTGRVRGALASARLAAVPKKTAAAIEGEGRPPLVPAAIRRVVGVPSASPTTTADVPAPPAEARPGPVTPWRGDAPRHPTARPAPDPSATA